MKLFIDTNIIVDVLTRRKGYEASSFILSLGNRDGYKLYASVLTMANIVYIMRQVLKGEALYTKLHSLNNIFEVASTTSAHYYSALELKATDFEDALQYFCALSCSCDVIITRNKKDFSFSSLPVMSPEEFI